MPSVIYKHKKHYEMTDEIRKKISETHKRLGTIPPDQTGTKFSKEARQNLSKAKMGHKTSEETKRKIGLANKGNKFSKEIRLRMSENRMGVKSSNWKGGISPENKRIRHGIRFRLWREAIFTRDNWTCQKYGTRTGNLNPHHILNFSQYIDLRFIIDNGITLSEKAHKEFHQKYGYSNNTKEQLTEFLQVRH